jgi:hypothetical protein
VEGPKSNMLPMWRHFLCDEWNKFGHKVVTCDDILKNRHGAHQLKRCNADCFGSPCITMKENMEFSLLSFINNPDELGKVCSYLHWVIWRISIVCTSSPAPAEACEFS